MLKLDMYHLYLVHHKEIEILNSLYQGLILSFANITLLLEGLKLLHEL